MGVSNATSSLHISYLLWTPSLCKLNGDDSVVDDDDDDDDDNDNNNNSLLIMIVVIITTKNWAVAEKPRDALVISLQ